MAAKSVKETIHAKGIDIGIYTSDFENEFISLTDIARYKSDNPNATICNWMRNRETLEFLGLWETLHNPDFKPLEFDGFRSQAGLNAFTMSPKCKLRHKVVVLYLAADWLNEKGRLARK
jgi:hypothetical protein